MHLLQYHIKPQSIFIFVVAGKGQQYMPTLIGSRGQQAVFLLYILVYVLVYKHYGYFIDEICDICADSWLYSVDILE